MSRPRKYPKTTGHYNYVHILPNEMFYIGESGQQPSERWRPSAYKNTVLGPYIEEYGWDSIRHVVLKDGLTKEQSVKLEGLLIEEATRQGFCLNEQGSGGKWRDNPTETRREWEREYRQRPEVQEREREWQREYRKTEKFKEYQREWHREYSKTEKYKEYKREWQHEYHQRPEVKERRREYHQRPEYKEYQREYNREYRKTEKYKEYQRQYRLKKKALKN